ncbi:Vascular endothelial growth factor receptor 1 [Hypsibius exemplaris]|uniref:receptor protein-tyrosine kinase n=1 Tax=Hypsibius exemplaris TaxID=2072580 RepID=A0A1W0WES2_HYPEX|nr:Vascular endothelial growth factor receptor 1 [Hypsibius exemplaris]
MNLKLPISTSHNCDTFSASWRFLFLLCCWLFLTTNLPRASAQPVVSENLTSRAPVIDPPVYNFEMQLGQTWTLTCIGDRQLNWKLPPDSHNEGGKIVIDAEPLPTGKYKATLTLPRVTASDTGRYKCHYADTPVADSEGDRDDVSFINVFVNCVLYPNQLWVQSPNGAGGAIPTFVTLTENQPGIIPCLSTYSAAEVQLLSGHSETPVHKTADVKYEPSVGFTIFYPNVFFSGDFKCRYIVRWPGLSQPKQQDQQLQLNYVSDSEAPKPTIDTSTARHVVAGKSFVMTCNVTTQEDVPVRLHWEYPSPSTKSRARDITVQNQKQTENYIYRLTQNTLTVSDVDEVADDGAYTCISTLLANGKKSSASVSIKPYSAGVESHLDLRPIRTVVEVNKGEKASLEVDFNAYPTPSFVWKRNGERVRRGGRYTMGLEGVNGNRTVLRIVDSSGADAGNYTLEASVKDTMSSINITLLVNERPAIVDLQSNSSRPFFLADGRLTFECIVTGFPTPDIVWSFQACSRSCADFDPQGTWTDVASEKISTSVDAQDRKVHSRYPVQRVREIGSGFLRCKAINLIGGKKINTERVERILISDFPEGLVTRIVPERPIESQEVVMTCSANNYEYNDAVWESRSFAGDDFVPLSRNNPSFRLKSEATLFSHVSTLTIPSAHNSLNGEYRCVAIIKSSGSKRLTTPIRLSLTGAVAPEFEPHVFQDPYDKEVDYQGTLRLDCTTKGLPPPVYEWTKADINIGQIGAIRFENNGAVLINEKITQDDHGVYACNASNSRGFVKKSWKVQVQGESAAEMKRRYTIVGFAVGTVVLILLPILIFVCFRLKTEKKRREQLEYLEGMLNNDTANPALIDPTVPLTDQVQLLPYEEKWEVPRENLKLFNKVLGSGQFGRVLKGEALNLLGVEGRTIVAVKMLKETADIVQRKALLGEIKIMAHIGQNLNVVNLLGAVTKDMNKGELYMLTEYCRHGSLRDYLQSHQGNRFFNQVDVITGNLLPLSEEQLELLNKMQQDLTKTEKNWDGKIVTTRDLICYAFQISNGMEYLVSKNVIHRDLAARNVLVAEENVVKICDFGLAKQEYNYMRKTQLELPIKWMAIESIYEQKFSKESDVWSFGVTLWELFTLGSTPYPGVNVDSDFVERVRSGYRMERPYLSPKEIYEIMRHCWEAPQKAATFPRLALNSDLLNIHLDKYIDMNAPYELYNEEHASAYMNDPVKRSSVAAAVMSYLNSYAPHTTDRDGCRRLPTVISSQAASLVRPPALHNNTPRCDGVATFLSRGNNNR